MRHRPSCKKCGGIDTVKNGHNRCGTQRYKCKNCHAVFVWKYDKEKTPKNKKKLILNCYVEGMGIRSLCRVFKVATKTLRKWISTEGEEFKQPDISEEKFVSCDEMWTFVGKKEEKSWIWLVYSKMTQRVLGVYI
jgi:transposase-like protein